MLRKEAMVRAAMVAHYARMLAVNKKNFVHPAVYQHIQWYVAHVALVNVFDEKDSAFIIEGLLQNITCCNPGLLGYLIHKNNPFTEYFKD